MAAESQSQKVEERLLTVKLSYSNTSNRFFIDLWESNEKYVVSVNVSEKVIEGVSRDTGIKIMIQ
jgi:hypothetical protein